MTILGLDIYFLNFPLIINLQISDNDFYFLFIRLRKNENKLRHEYKYTTGKNHYQIFLRRSSLVGSFCIKFNHFLVRQRIHWTLFKRLFQRVDVSRSNLGHDNCIWITLWNSISKSIVAYIIYLSKNISMILCHAGHNFFIIYINHFPNHN